MKRCFAILLVLCVICVSAKAQAETALVAGTDSLVITSESHTNHSVPLANGLREPRFKLYRTQNEWIFLKLDTMTGQIWQVQVAPDRSRRIEYVLDDKERMSSSDEELCGRFTLYETTNMYRFVLLDTIDGRCWQVQWNYKKELRGVVRILLANV